MTVDVLQLRICVQTSWEFHQSSEHQKHILNVSLKWSKIGFQLWEVSVMGPLVSSNLKDLQMCFTLQNFMMAATRSRNHHEVVNLPYPTCDYEIKKIKSSYMKDVGHPADDFVHNKGHEEGWQICDIGRERRSNPQSFSWQKLSKATPCFLFFFLFATDKEFPQEEIPQLLCSVQSCLKDPMFPRYMSSATLASFPQLKVPVSFIIRARKAQKCPTGAQT